jgi:Excalibur calcium-binding domain
MGFGHPNGRSFGLDVPSRYDADGFVVVNCNRSWLGGSASIAFKARRRGSVLSAAVLLVPLVGVGCGSGADGRPSEVEAASESTQPTDSEASASSLPSTSNSEGPVPTTSSTSGPRASTTSLPKSSVSSAVTVASGQPSQSIPSSAPAPSTTAQAPTTQAPVTQAPTPSGGLDPQFSSCSKAKEAGYGPYVRGTDPEYDWYSDRDGDGVACE